MNETLVAGQITQTEKTQGQSTQTPKIPNAI